jgi:stearoyl-CoA desaturase (delta-9 desaturase)
VLEKEKAVAKGNAAFRRARQLLVRRPTLLNDSAHQRLSDLLDDNAALRTVHEYREKLSEIWTSANVSNEKLLDQLRAWIAEAEASGIKVLEDFADRLRSYQLATA